jgi:spore maturation protein CgeB
VSGRPARGVGEREPLKVAIVGRFSGAHLAGSLARAAERLGVETIRLDTAEAAGGPRWLGALRWRLADRRPPRLDRFSAGVVDRCVEARPDVLIATGSAALTERALQKLKSLGVVCVDFSTDDPWNAAVRSDWHLRALPHYDLVFTPRRANLDDFVALGCPAVRYLPFGYDETLFAPPDGDDEAPSHDVLFVGGGDRDRAGFMAAFMRSGPPVALIGGYWERFAATREQALGPKSPEVLRGLTAAAKVNLCLVRTANRDGHVMRSFETAAIGGCMLVEDTAEHREIFGADGTCVVYFRDPAEAAERARVLLADAVMRTKLANCVHQRILEGGHTYRHRLQCMLEATGREAAP